MTNQISLATKVLLLSRKQTNGDNVAATPRNDQPQQAPQPVAVEEDLPF